MFLRTVALCALLSLTAARVAPPTPQPAHTSGPNSRPARAVSAGSAIEAPAAGAGRAELIDYNPVADPAAVVLASDKLARFTVLTPRLIRMELAKAATPGVFEDRATLAMMNRGVAVPAFTHAEAGGVLTIATSAVTLTYTLGAGFTPTSLSVAGNGSGAFKSWHFGDAFPGNLLGTIRGQDGQSATPLNCTINAGVDDNGEFNHCEWGLASRDGWTVYNDSANVALDAQDWWSTAGAAPRECSAPASGFDATNPANSGKFPEGTTVSDTGACCDACLSDPSCVAGYVYSTDAGASPNCWPLASVGGRKPVADRELSTTANPSSLAVDLDLYGYFHGHDYFGAIADHVLVSGKAIMVPKYAAGVWNSRWFDYSSADNAKLVEDYKSRRMPLDVFVIDMQWHRKNDWSGFTYDEHLYPNSSDAMAYFKALGLGITINIHDASGVNNWEALFPTLAAYLGLPANATVVPFNLLNSTVAYGVEDIVLGDLINNQHVDFMWIDWQQGGDAGGMTGGKQNPTFWLNHLRCTDRHRAGDNRRAMVLARWGGMGMHRYQTGFSGDVAALTWADMLYQPYFSATSTNVAHGFWSHDIVGPPDDIELYTRWIQIGAFSGVMRSHDRGGSAGGCNNNVGGATWTTGCWVVEPWNVLPNYFEANRAALQLREELVPYIYSAQRDAFDTGVGLIIPMYYFFPELDAAYTMDGVSPAFVQYMFGRSILFSPVTTPADIYAFGPGLASKTTWLPPGVWYDATTGAMLAGGPTTMHAGTYTLAQIPLFYAAGAVIPYLPLRSLPVIGLAARQYSFLGFKIVPGASSGTASVYEDDGVTTAYLTDNAYARTTASYVTAGGATTVTIATAGPGFPELPATRAYQLRVLNGGTLASVTVNGVPVAFNRWGTVASADTVPPTSQWYWSFESNQGGMGPVVDVVGASTAAPLTVVLTWATPAIDASAGHYGYISRAIWAKTNTDLDRSTPASNSPGPAYMSVLASTGEALTALAGNNAAAFAAALNNVTTLLPLARADVGADKSPRANMSLALLSAGW